MNSTPLWATLLLLLLRWTSARSDPPPVYCNSTDPALVRRILIEGESLWFYPRWADPDNRVVWYHNASQGVASNDVTYQEVTQVSTGDEEPVYSKGPGLVLLNATRGRCGCYMAQEMKNGSLFQTHFLEVSMVPKNSSKRYFGQTSFSGTKAFVSCPDPVTNACDALNGTYSWYKDDVPLPDRHNEVEVMTMPGLYDCVCTWTHRSQQYRAIGTRRVIYKKPPGPSIPLQILEPVDKTRSATTGERLELKCTVRCGVNINPSMCKAYWKITSLAQNSEGYNFYPVVSPSNSEETIVTEVFTIERVSPPDFERDFQCVGRSQFEEPVYFNLRLEPRESMVPLVAVVTSVFLVSIFLAVMVKYFSIDLALFFRRFIPFRLKENGLKMFDAYVVYQLQSQNKAIEDALTRFISQDLPFILEEQCGYKLFIHGRDDLPGEDRVELVEQRMRMSRRLIVVLTAASGSEVSKTIERPEGYDWQVGLHQALVQRDLSVILIQLGDMDCESFKHLPPALQHLIQTSAPLRWPMEPRTARVNSRFWKRVRFLMPAAPIQKFKVSII